MSQAASPRPGIAERLSRMIQVPTVSAELDVRGHEPFEAFVSLLAELYPRIHASLELERITDFGLLYRWPGATPTADPVVLMAHYDVVPVDESDPWTHPPFEGHIEGGSVYGRGALDDKGPLVVLLDAVENLLADEFVPARDVYLSFGGNEETFGAAAQAIVEVFRERELTPWLVLDEGGAVTDAPLPFVLGLAAMVGVGEKGVATVQLTARSDGGHASTPPPLTAVGRVSRAVSRLTPTTFTARVPAAITRMLGLFAARSTGVGRLLYRLLAAWPWLNARGFARLGGEAAALVRTTVAPTKITGGTAHNVLPSQAEAVVNLRLALGETVAGTVRRLQRRIADRSVAVEVLEGSDASPESPSDGPQFALIAEAVRVSHPAAITVPYVTMAATDSRYFHQICPATYRFAPLLMNAEQRASIHGVDERVDIAELERGERFHRTLIEGIRA
ncbi:M20/M25/M40 family metallo-hydrolase [Gulosibacter sp. ACHW.36C]|uniref:M20/M25/M40 family metallo-hydrolase n=1 Tax=Gulosibacter sediminis TaxID=1729695 RepID=A0ABY4MYB7_9MICO|nr:M20/M25/M40 family metallo-hydrolase [Gulosibacter sediminis]UQN15438.1 M20/M25/M40 family metallo-hydrolase [Gulosibacter sediminis]